MKQPQLIILAGSAGSFYVIYEIIKTLPLSFKIPLVVVMHRGKSINTKIEELWSNKNIQVREILDKDEIQSGKVFVCPADYHLHIEKDKFFSLDISEPIMFSRPSIDLTLESAANVYQDKLMGILFSGANHDGSRGLVEVKRMGGQTIVHDPKEAEDGIMPMAAIASNAAENVMKLEEIKRLLQSFTK